MHQGLFGQRLKTAMVLEPALVPVEGPALVSVLVRVPVPVPPGRTVEKITYLSHFDVEVEGATLGVGDEATTIGAGNIDNAIEDSVVSSDISGGSAFVDILAHTVGGSVFVGQHSANTLLDWGSGATPANSQVKLRSKLVDGINRAVKWP